MSTRLGFLRLAGVAVIAATIAGSAWSDEGISKPNVVFILADDLGYGDVSCLNPDSKIQTPHLDQLARKGRTFTDAHAPGSICVPSRYGLLTGRYPFRNWISENASKRERNGREIIHYPAPMLSHEPDRLNLASLMKRNGYATAAFGKWHQGMSRRTRNDGSLDVTPVDLGFDFYFGYDAPEQGPYVFIENRNYVAPLTREISEQLGQDVTNPKTQGAHWYTGPASEMWSFETALPRLGNRVDRWLEQHIADENAAPFFMYYAIPAPHAPWVPDKRFKGKSGAGQYGDYVMTMDALVGRVLDTLDRLKLTDETLVIFSSDNGPVWYEQDVERYGHRAVGEFSGMKGAMEEGGHRMPFFARWPGRIEVGSQSDALICFTDMMATFASIVGDKLPEDAGEDSYDILPHLLGEPTNRPIRSHLISPNWGSYNLSFREGSWKLILPPWTHQVRDGVLTPDHLVDTEGKTSRQRYQLFNLEDDPSESVDLSEEHPERVQLLFNRLLEEVKRGRSPIHEG